METVPPQPQRFPPFLLVLLLAFGVYLAGLLPFVYWADSSELTLGGFLLGLSHAPSFPLYALLLKGLNFLPMGDIAFKASLLSALCGALGVAGVFALARVLCRAGLTAVAPDGETSTPTLETSETSATEVALLAAFLYGVSGPAWQVACRQEVYTLHGVTALFILGTVLAWAKDQHPRWLLLAGFAFGLGMGNHSLLMLALFPPILLFLGVTQARAALQPRVLLWTAGAFLLGLSIYLYLPLRSATQPLLDTNDPETLSGFLDSFTKRTEKGLFVGESGWFEHLQVFAAQLVDAFTPSLVWLGAFGILPWFQRYWRRAAFFVLLMAFNVLSVVMGPEYTWDNPDIPGYLLLTYALFAVLLATGLARVLDGLTQGKPHAHWIRRGVVLGVGALAWFTASPRLPASGDARAAAYGELHLGSAPLGAILIVKSDAAHFIPYYQQIAEGRRPDLALVNRKGVANLAYIDQVSRWDETVFAPHPTPVQLPSQAPDSGANTVRKSWDTSYALEADVRALVANSLPRRVVLWEPGGDNRWAVPLSRPLGPWLELNSQPIQLGPTDHAQNLRYQQTVRRTLAAPGLPVDPRANQALEVICFNLSNTLWRETPATPAQRAEGYGELWRVRPDFLPAGVQFGQALEEQAHYAEASQVYSTLLDLAPQDARIVEGLRRSQGGLQGEGP